MADVFISYSHEQREVAQRLAKAIEGRGWTTWWDRQIPAGTSYHALIERQLDLARCVVVLWTTESVASEWVRNEAAEGAHRNILIPVCQGDVRVPLAFRHLQSVAVSHWTTEEFAECLDSIQSMIGTSASSHTTHLTIDRLHHQQKPAGPTRAETINDTLSLSDASAESVQDSVATIEIDTIQPKASARRKQAILRAGASFIALIAVAIAVFLTQRRGAIEPTTPALSTAADTLSTTAHLGTAQYFTAGSEIAASGHTDSRDVFIEPKTIELRTTHGAVTIELFSVTAPAHARNFLIVAQSGGLDGVSINQIGRRGFVVGRSSLDQTLPIESSDLVPVRGTVLGIARSGTKESATEFLVLAGDALDRGPQKNTVWGRVIRGMDVVDRIYRLPVDAEERPIEPVTVVRASVGNRY